MYSGAVWADNDNAFLEGTAGTVTLGENINITHLNVNAANYVIDGSQTLNFTPGGSDTSRA